VLRRRRAVHGREARQQRLRHVVVLHLYPSCHRHQPNTPHASRSDARVKFLTLGTSGKGGRGKRLFQCDFAPSGVLSSGACLTRGHHTWIQQQSSRARHHPQLTLTLAPKTLTPLVRRQRNPTLTVG
jgi:hypothetical protein